MITSLFEFQVIVKSHAYSFKLLDLHFNHWLSNEQIREKKSLEMSIETTANCGLVMTFNYDFGSGSPYKVYPN